MRLNPDRKAARKNAVPVLERRANSANAKSNGVMNDVNMLLPIHPTPPVTPVVPASIDGEDAGSPNQKIGEGSYEGTAQYAKSVARYLKTADVKADARKAAPRNPSESKVLHDAEKRGARRSKSPGK